MGRVTLRISGTQLLCQMNILPYLPHSSRTMLKSNISVVKATAAPVVPALVAGQVDWIAEPLAFIQPGEILPCCCRAKGDIEIEL